MEKGYAQRKKELLGRKQALENELINLHEKSNQALKSYLIDNSSGIGKKFSWEEYRALWKKSYNWTRNYEISDEMSNINHKLLLIRWEDEHEQCKKEGKLEEDSKCSHPKNKEIITGNVWPMLFVACGICGVRYQRPWEQEDINHFGDPRENM